MASMRVCSASADRSTRATGMPLLAKHMAIPPPIVPAPMTAADLIGRGLAVTPATFEISRSAKNTCWSARACGPAASSAKSADSRARPSSKELAETAASTASTILSGAISPLACLRTMSRAAPKKPSAPPGTSSGRREMTRDASSPASASRSASATAASSTACPSAPSMISSAKPILAACSAPTGMPPVIILRAASHPITRGKRCVPPAPGSKPRWTSGRPHIALLANSRQWHARASSRPPPKAVPCTAATVGTFTLSRRSMTSPSIG
mmetsp:Transcript_25390/g.82075  ORF Transcript_25390/g.82075 Transcript_25390/m.82075 type:complete len:268 (-) Transcript_25390:304-1107(-)